MFTETTSIPPLRSSLLTNSRFHHLKYKYMLDNMDVASGPSGSSDKPPLRSILRKGSYMNDPLQAEHLGNMSNDGDIQRVDEITANNTDINRGARRTPHVSIIEESYADSVFWKTTRRCGGGYVGIEELKAQMRLLDAQIDEISDDEVYVQLYKDNPWFNDDEYKSEDISHILRFGPFKNKKQCLIDLNIKRVWMDTTKNQVNIYTPEPSEISEQGEDDLESNDATLEGEEYDQKENLPPGNSLPLPQFAETVTGSPSCSIHETPAQILVPHTATNGGGDDQLVFSVEHRDIGTPRPTNIADMDTPDYIPSCYTHVKDENGSEVLQLAPPNPAALSLGHRTNTPRACILPRNSDGRFNRVESFVPKGWGNAVALTENSRLTAKAVYTAPQANKSVVDPRTVDEFAEEEADDQVPSPKPAKEALFEQEKNVQDADTDTAEDGNEVSEVTGTRSFDIRRPVSWLRSRRKSNGGRGVENGR